AGIDDRDEDRPWPVIWRGSRKIAGAINDGKGRDLVGDVHDFERRINAQHHRLADRDRIILQAEVGHEYQRVLCAVPKLVLSLVRTLLPNLIARGSGRGSLLRPDFG